ncbi:MAG: autotransporter-associated beta strand repeat-containing protein, partial [Planctomycetia bacterium]|nr:autotransporter-associated beta strand repeat-containing protein [Planctomycetia bacterium]
MMKTVPLPIVSLLVFLTGVTSWGGGVKCVAQDWVLTTPGNHEVTEDKSYSGVYYRQASLADAITVTVSNNATMTVSKSLWMGDNGTSGTCSLIIDNGHLRLSGNASPGGDYLYGKYNLLGHFPNSNSTLHLKSGTLTVDTHLNVGWHSKGTLTIDGGTATIENIGFNSSDRKNEDGGFYYGASQNCWGTLNLNGGVLKLGSIESRHQTSYPNNYTINLAGGTLQPKNNTLTVGLNGTLTSGKTTTFHADSGQTLEWSGNLSGGGNLTTTGGGKIVLSGNAGTSTSRLGTVRFNGTYESNTWQRNTVDITGTLASSIFYVGGSTVNIEDGATVTVSMAKIGEGNNTPTAIVNQNGGVFNHTGSRTLSYNAEGKITNVTNGSIFMIGHYPSHVEYNLNGGTLNATETWAQIGWANYSGAGGASASLNISGGTANLKGAFLIKHKANVPTALNLTGGRLNLGEYGIKAIETDGAGDGALSWEMEQDGNQTVTLGTGTLGALANWNSKLKMTLLDNSVTTIDTQNPTNDAGQTITLSGALSGNGGVTKTGAGTLVLSGENTYTGKTTVEMGTLELNGSVAGAVELAGDVILTGNGRLQSLNLGTGGEHAQVLISVGENAESLAVAGTAELWDGMFDFLFEDIHAVADQPMQIFSANTYSGWEGALDALLADTWQGIIHLSLQNSGIYATVDSAAIPEPSTWLLGLLGMGLLFW